RPGVLAARRPEPDLPASRIDIIEHLLKDSRVDKLLILPPEFQRGRGVLDAVMCVLLDLLFQHAPGEELEVELAVKFALEEEIDSVDDLLLRHVDVDGAEVIGEGVADEDTT